MSNGKTIGMILFVGGILLLIAYGIYKGFQEIEIIDTVIAIVVGAIILGFLALLVSMVIEHGKDQKKMKEENAELAGEMSGHMFFADRYFGYDDATYACCRLLEILADTGKTVSELLSDIPKTYNTPEIRVDCPDNVKFSVVAKLTEIFRKVYDVIDIDGARIVFEDGWGLVRASNTQPALVLRFEALSETRMAEIRELVESTLETVKKEM